MLLHVKGPMSTDTLLFRFVHFFLILPVPFSIYGDIESNKMLEEISSFDKLKHKTKDLDGGEVSRADKSMKQNGQHSEKKGRKLLYKQAQIAQKTKLSPLSFLFCTQSL